MIKSLFFLILQLVALTGFCQNSPEEVSKKLNNLIADAPSGFVINTGDKINDDTKNNVVIYKSKTIFTNDNEFIMLDNDTHKKAFACIIKQAPNTNVNVEALKLYVNWNQTIFELGKTGKYKYERKPSDQLEGGFITTLKDSNDKTIVTLINNSTQKKLMVLEVK